MKRYAPRRLQLTQQLSDISAGQSTLLNGTRSIWKMLGPFATASRRTLPVLILHCHSPGVATVARRLRYSNAKSMSTTTTRDRGDRYGPIEWAQSAWQAAPPSKLNRQTDKWTEELQHCLVPQPLTTTGRRHHKPRDDTMQSLHEIVLTCRKYCWSVCGCTLVGRETCHISDAGLSWGSLAHVDLRCQTAPAAATNTASKSGLKNLSNSMFSLTGLFPELAAH